MTRTLLVLALVACAPPAPPMSQPPARPTLELPASSATNPTTERSVVLRGTTDPGTRVRIFLGRSCEGLPLLQLDDEALRRGHRLDTVHGENVFSARAFAVATGLQSECSEPVSLFVLIPSRGQLTAPTVLTTTPRVPTSALAVRLLGTAPRPGWTVRAWASESCEGELLASMPGDDYSRDGLLVPLRRNTTLRVTLDAIRGAEMTLCNGGVLMLTNDARPPLTPRPSWFPSPPFTFPRLALVVEEVERDTRLEVSMGAGCRAPLAVTTYEICGAPERCANLVSSFDAGTELVSLKAVDESGNESPCVELPQVSRSEPVDSPVYAEPRRVGQQLIGIGVSLLPGDTAFFSERDCPPARRLGGLQTFTGFGTTSTLPAVWSFGVIGDGGVCWNGP